MTKNPFLLGSAALVAAVLAGCESGGRQTATQQAMSAPAPAAAPAAATILSPAQATLQAPETYQAKFSTTKGDFTITVHRSWAPNGADRFYNLVKMGYYNNVPFFRVIDGFMVQFGISGDPAVNAQWRDADIPDDPAAGHSNTRGMVSFATAGPNTRTTQVFINYADNGRLDSMGFTPIGEVSDGMPVVDSLYKGYGEGAPSGSGPDQSRLQTEGNAYIKQDFPQMDFVTTATVE